MFLRNRESERVLIDSIVLIVGCESGGEWGFAS